MHQCPACYEDCDCDGDDVWDEEFPADECSCECQDDDGPYMRGEFEDDGDDAEHDFTEGDVIT